MEWRSAQDVVVAIHAAELECNDPLEHELSAKGVEAFPESAELWAMHARYLWLEMHEDESDAAIDKAMALDPDCAVAWAARASIAACSGSVDEALSSATRALELDAGNPVVLAYCMDAYDARGDVATAISLSEKLCDVMGNDAGALRHRIDTLAFAGRKEEALKLLDEAERLYPNCVLIMRKRALYMMRSELPAAIRLFRTCVERSPGCSTSWAHLSMALAGAQLYDEAEECARKALEINPRAVAAMGTLAKLCLRAGKRDESAEWQRKAAEAFPGIAFTRGLLPASNAVRAGQWAKAAKLAEPLLSAPAPVTRHTAGGIRARALLEMGRIREAEQLIDQLVAEGWQESARYELRGRILMGRCDRDGAIAELRAGLEKHPTDGLIRTNLLRALGNREYERERESLIADIMENPPDTPWGLNSVARTLLQMNYKQEAYKLRWICQQRFPDATEFHMLSLGDWLRRIWALFRILLRVLWIKHTR